jgi:hypothetical protein
MASTADLVVELPDEPLQQDEEQCEIVVDGRRQRVRFHDYAAVYAIPASTSTSSSGCWSAGRPRSSPGCCSASATPRGLAVLDFGAGNGMVGAELRRGRRRAASSVRPARRCADAALRDRPGVYDDYVVCDITDPVAAAPLDDHRFTALTCVAALGFGDVPPAAFVAAFDRIADGGAIAFTIKEDFLADGEPSAFARLIAVCSTPGAEERGRERYVHRLAADGRPLHYVAFDAVQARAGARRWLRS